MVPKTVANFTSKELVWEDKCKDILTQIWQFLGEEYQEIEEVWIEYPEYMEGVRGEATAKVGSLVKLSFFCGLLTGMFWDTYYAKVNLVPVHKWKGQLPKLIVQRKIVEYYPSIHLELAVRSKIRFTDHIWDAIGLGLYGKGVLFNE